MTEVQLAEVCQCLARRWIARLVGHRSTAVTEAVYRKQLSPVLTEGAEAMDRIFSVPDAEPNRDPVDDP